jgi:superfamily II DNA or RNA helicase
MKFLIKNKIEILTNNKVFLQSCKKALTVRNPMFDQAVKYGRFVGAIERKIKLYTLIKGGIVVPRGFFLTAIKSALDSTGKLPEIIDKLPKINSINVESKVVLREYQERFVKDIIKGGSGIAVASPGSGKTVIGMELISRLKMKTLWITHTGTLAKQSISRAKEFLNTDKIGYIGGGKWDIQDVTVALVQTLSRRDLSSIAKEFPLIIIDECHHIPAKMFSTVIEQFWLRRCIGLSATPYRRDSMEDIMYGIVGPQIASVSKEELIDLGFLIPAKIIQKETNIHIDGMNYRGILNSIYRSKKRRYAICSDILVESTLGNVCIVLVNKIDYGRKITETLKSFGVSAELVFSSETTTEKKIRGKKPISKTITMSKKMREKIITDFSAGKINILVATYSLLAEGFDHKPLNRLFLATPISDKNQALLEQTCGRVERPSKGKVDAVVYDYVDINSLLLHQARMRIEVYKSNFMEVESNI